MCKSIKNAFYSNLTFEKLLQAHQRAKQGKMNKVEVLKFELDLETNIMNLYRAIKNGKYHMGKYREFIIYEPKERIIKALPYVDRVVHQWYIQEFIKPFIVPRFINDSYACIEHRGTHKAIGKVQKYMRQMKRKYHHYYVLKCDIQKYFYSIDKDILFSIMKRNISDRKLLELTKIFIYDDNSTIGIPIGNYTSQFYANIYLNELDHYVKEKLHVKYYVRYMDDFIILVETKSEAKKLLEKIDDFLKTKLNLRLNKKTNYYPSKLGIDFCGYVIYETHIRIRKRCKNKIKKQIKEWNNLYLIGTIDYHKVLLCFNSFKGHIQHSNSYNLLNSLKEKLYFDITRI